MKVFCQIKRVALSVLYVFFFGSTVSLTLFGAKLDLSDQQEAYRKSNPVIRIGIMEAWPPMGFMDSTGKAIGISADLLEHLSRITGFNFEMVSGPFFELFEMVKHGEIDALMDTTPTSERMDHLLFTRPYLTIPHVIVGRRDSPVYGSLDDLSHARIALEKGFYLIPLLRNLYPDISILEMPSTLQALEAVSMEMADVYIGNRAAVFYLMVQHLLANLKVHSQIDPEGSVNAIAVNKDHPHLASILDQALGLVPAEEWFAVLRKWTEGLEEQQDQFMLTLEERIWLENHRPIRIGIMDQWPPMNFVDAQGKPAGIGVDFLDALNLRMGGVFEIHPGNFAENMRRVQVGELDALMDITPTLEREEHFHFTRTYLDIPHVIVAQRDGVFFHGEVDLYGKVLALERGYGNVAYFRENHPQVTVREYNSTSLCLDAVSKGEADAYAGNRAVASFIIEQELITNLQIQGRLSKEGFLLSIGIRKDWPELTPIIDRALSSIGIEEVRAIHRRWTGFDDIQADLQSSLTDQETSWLSQQTSLSIGFSSQWPPFEFLDEQDQPAGVVSDYISWIGNQLYKKD